MHKKLTKQTKTPNLPQHVKTNIMHTLVTCYKMQCAFNFNARNVNVKQDTRQP